MKNSFKQLSTLVLCAGVLTLLPRASLAQGVAVPTVATAPSQVVITGTLPDDASKLLILTKLREVYGADKVVDQITVGAVVMPPNWSTYVQKLITPNLKLVSRGQLKVDGNVVNMRGEVANEAQKQQIMSEMASSLNQSYVVYNGLRITASDQGVLDQTLANRVIEFESSRAYLEPSGKLILDEMIVALKKLKSQKVEIIGHTDDQGLRTANVSLSQARAVAVKSYFTEKGLDAKLITTSGAGPDRPVASNTTGEGRARNRRIEFRLSQ